MSPHEGRKSTGPSDAMVADPTGEASFHVLVAMHNEVGRRGLCAMLRMLPAVDDVRGCGGLQEAAKQLLETEYDVLIVCTDADLDEFGTLKEVISRTCAKTLLLLRGSDNHDLARAVCFNADGYLLENVLTSRTLEQALSRLVNGEMPLPASLARELLAQVRRRAHGAADRPFLLTARERQALDLLAEGLSNKQIARRLGISEHGAKRHVANVLAKLNCPNRTLAVALALRDGLVDGT